MHIMEMMLIIMGISLEILNRAVHRGANQRQLTQFVRFIISIIGGIVIALVMYIGMLIAIVPQAYLKGTQIIEANRWFASVLLIFVGIKIFIKLKKNRQLEEHREEALSYKQMIIMGLSFSMDAGVIGMVLGLVGASYYWVYIMGFFICIAIYAGLWLGERLGGGLYRVHIDLCSSIILIVVGIKMTLQYLELI